MRAGAVGARVVGLGGAGVEGTAEGEGPLGDGVTAEAGVIAGGRGPTEDGNAARDGLAAGATGVGSAVVVGVASEGAVAEGACEAGTGVLGGTLR